ncbi:MAG: metallophosphoesterase [Anaerolineae bacterium]|nr:metallophosphoesterase [Phycisphaerae bacterium]
MSSFDADQTVELLGSAADENKLSALRNQQVVQLPEQGEVWMTGDIHDHRANLAKLIAAADLANNPQRHLVLHELIHGDHYDPKGAEDSWVSLARAAELKCDFPNQIHFMLANHDLAQIHGEGIMKAGTSVCEAFNSGIKRDFKDQATVVTVAVTEFLLSFPLAIRAGELFFCHSLPTDEQIQNFDFTVFDRELSGPDYRRRTGPVYQLIWGRNVTPAGVKVFAEKVGARTIVTGHQPQESGFHVNGDQHLIIASDHNQGVMLPIELGKSYDAPTLAGRLKKFVAIEL